MTLNFEAAFPIFLGLTSLLITEVISMFLDRVILKLPPNHRTSSRVQLIEDSVNLFEAISFFQSQQILNKIDI